MGSREFYRLLEIVLSNRLLEFGKDEKFLTTIIDIYEKSGLCTPQFLESMKDFFWIKLN